MTRVMVTAGGNPANRAGEWRTRLSDMTESEGLDVEARRLSQRVTCSTCGGQATAHRGRVFIAHRPRCARSAR